MCPLQWWWSCGNSRQPTGKMSGWKKQYQWRNVCQEDRRKKDANQPIRRHRQRPSQGYSWTWPTCREQLTANQGTHYDERKRYFPDVFNASRPGFAWCGITLCDSSSPIESAIRNFLCRSAIRSQANRNVAHQTEVMRLFYPQPQTSSQTSFS